MRLQIYLFYLIYSFVLLMEAKSAINLRDNERELCDCDEFLLVLEYCNEVRIILLESRSGLH